MRMCLVSAGLSLVITMLSAGQEMGEPGSEMGRDEAVAAFRDLGGRVRYDEKNPERPIVVVDLVQTDVADADLVLLKGLTHIRSLYLNSTRVTDAGLQHLKGLTSLEVLRLGGYAGDFGSPHRRYGAQVTDDGLEHLKGLANLQVLSLRVTGVTNAGLEHLKRLTNLQLLMLEQTRVTDAGVNELKKALPKSQVLYLPARGCPMQSPR